MAGERTGVRYRLGDRLTIKVVRVDLETTKIDFTLVNKNNDLSDKNKVNSPEESEEAHFNDKIATRSVLKLKPGKPSPLEGAASQKTKSKSFGKPSGKSKTSSAKKTGTTKAKSAGKKSKRSGR